MSGTPIYFRNTTSLGAGDARVGFVTETVPLHTLKQMDDQLCSVPSRDGELWRFCKNAEVYGSNWLVKADDPQTFALPARNNRSTPGFKTIERLERFLKIGIGPTAIFSTPMLRF
ncbi:zinc-ribbon domain-containing protein [Agrobacterium sp. S2]|nr:zinc-ribbon domain-containing protein [Agrobacterium sp. S2]